MYSYVQASQGVASVPGYPRDFDLPGGYNPQRTYHVCVLLVARSVRLVTVVSVPVAQLYEYSAPAWTYMLHMHHDSCISMTVQYVYIVQVTLGVHRPATYA